MKKMLTMLFLLFSLSTMEIGSTASPALNKTELDALTERDELRNILKSNIEELAGEAYLYWDSIPVRSPMNLSNIIRISSDYGLRTHPIYKIRMFHRGIDLAGKYGVDVYSTADGVVTKRKQSKYGYGNQIIIEHSIGYSTRYAHLDNIFVSTGDSVRAGEKIGTLGSTGLSTGPHLHYEVLKDGTPIDPLFFTYSDDKDRSQAGYFNLIFALEKHRKLGMYHI